MGGLIWEKLLPPEELEQFFALASEANELGVRARNEIEDLRIRQEQLSGYAYSETVSLSEEVGKLSELVGLMFNILGVPIAFAQPEDSYVFLRTDAILKGCLIL